LEFADCRSLNRLLEVSRDAPPFILLPQRQDACCTGTLQIIGGIPLDLLQQIVIVEIDPPVRVMQGKTPITAQLCLRDIDPVTR
jgi:hypothetical protein